MKQFQILLAVLTGSIIATPLPSSEKNPGVQHWFLSPSQKDTDDVEILTDTILQQLSSKTILEHINVTSTTVKTTSESATVTSTTENLGTKITLKMDPATENNKPIEKPRKRDFFNEFLDHVKRIWRKVLIYLKQNLWL